MVFDLRITVRGRPNYWRYTLYNWLLEIKDILQYELGESIEVDIEDCENEDPELYIEGFYIGSGIPGEEGYLIEIIKKALRDLGFQWA